MIQKKKREEAAVVALQAALRPLQEALRPRLMGKYRVTLAALRRAHRKAQRLLQVRKSLKALVALLLVSYMKQFFKKLTRLYVTLTLGLGSDTLGTHGATTCPKTFMAKLTLHR